MVENQREEGFGGWDEMKARYINPFTDFGFKKLFGEEGREEGREEEKIKLIKKALKKGMKEELIKELTGVDIDKINRYKES